MTISASEEQEAITPMLNVPVRTEIPEIYRVGQEDQIKIKWTNNANQEMEFTAIDEDEMDGLIILNGSCRICRRKPLKSFLFLKH